MKIAVIVPAAGVGSRFAAAPEPVRSAGEGPRILNSQTGKIELPLAGKPVFLHAIDAFLGRPDVAAIVLAVHPARIDDFRLRWGDQLGFHNVSIVAGGTRERWETVLLALQAVPEDATHIAIHDAARPLICEALISRVFAAAARWPAVVPAISVSSTLKRVGPEEGGGAAPADPLDAIFDDAPAGGSAATIRRVLETVDRRDLVEVQTPQVFDAATLRGAYELLASGGVDASTVTDDAGLVEAMGHRVVAVTGESTNFKITHPGDAELAAALLERRAAANAQNTARKQLFNDDDDDD